jgi:hypothetical protein
MDKFLKQKIMGRDLAEERLRKQQELQQGMKDLKNAPVEMVDDFQKPMAKDLKPEVINTKEALPVQNAQVAMAANEAKKQAIAEMAGKAPQVEKSINYNDLRKEFAQKAKTSRAADLMKKKFMGAVPLLGAGYAALQGDPAMAAEELAQDAMGPAGLAYEAIRPSDSGNVEEERMMLAERDAQAAYAQSPARLARLTALKRMGQ